MRTESFIPFYNEYWDRVINAFSDVAGPNSPCEMQEFAHSFNLSQLSGVAISSVKYYRSHPPVVS